jgi:hypothetical protein
MFSDAHTAHHSSAEKSRGTATDAVPTVSDVGALCAAIHQALMAVTTPAGAAATPTPTSSSSLSSKSTAFVKDANSIIGGDGDVDAALAAVHDDVARRVVAAARLFTTHAERMLHTRADAHIFAGAAVVAGSDAAAIVAAAAALAIDAAAAATSSLSSSSSAPRVSASSASSSLSLSSSSLSRAQKRNGEIYRLLVVLHKAFNQRRHCRC